MTPAKRVASNPATVLTKRALRNFVAESPLRSRCPEDIVEDFVETVGAAARMASDLVVYEDATYFWRRVWAALSRRLEAVASVDIDEMLPAHRRIATMWQVWLPVANRWRCLVEQRRHGEPANDNDERMEAGRDLPRGV